MTVNVPDWVWWVLLGFVAAFLMFFAIAMVVLGKRSDQRIADVDFDLHVDDALDVANSRTHLRCIR